MRIESRRGRIEARVRIGDIPRGRLFVPFHFGYWDDPGRAQAANELTLFGCYPVSKQPYCKFLAVRIARVARPSTAQPDEKETKAPTLKDHARHAVEAMTGTIEPPRSHVSDYLALLIESETALARMLGEVSAAHVKDAGVHAMAKRMATWTLNQLDAIRPFVARYGDTSQVEPRRLSKAISPRLAPTGVGLLRDLQTAGSWRARSGSSSPSSARRRWRSATRS